LSEKDSGQEIFRGIFKNGKKHGKTDFLNQIKFFIGVGQGATGKGTYYVGEYFEDKMSGWGIIYGMKPKVGHGEIFRGQFVNGKKFGVGYKYWENFDVTIMTKFKGKYIKSDSYAELFNQAGILLAYGVTKRHFGRNISGFNPKPQDGLLGCLFEEGSRVVKYCGQMSYKTQKPFGIGAWI
jgi:hypothetical protein